MSEAVVRIVSEPADPGRGGDRLLWIRVGKGRYGPYTNGTEAKAAKDAAVAKLRAAAGHEVRKGSDGDEDEAAPEPWKP